MVGRDRSVSRERAPADPGETLDRLTDGVLGLDATGRITYANERAVALAARDRDALVGADATVALPAPAGQRFAAAVERAVDRQERVAFEAFHERAGEWLAVTLDPSPSGVTACLRDVTDRRADERSRSREQQRLRSVVESLDDAAMIKDRDGRYQLMNAACASAFGRPRAELIGRTDHELFGEVVGGRIREREREVLETGEARTYRQTLPTVNGERTFETTRSPYYGPGGDLAGTVGVCRDVTEQVAREREVTRYETLVETSPDAMFVIDADLTVTLVNDAVEDLTGFDRDAVSGSTVQDIGKLPLFDEENFEQVQDAVHALLDGDAQFEKVEVTLYEGGDEPVRVEYHMAAVPGDGDAGVVGVVRDVTDRARQQRRIRRQCDELETLARINALVQEIIDGLLGAASREEIESRVVEGLAASDLYESAWITERRGDGVEMRAGVGDADYFDAVGQVDVDDGVDARLAAGESVVFSDVATDERVPEDAREESLSRGFRSCVVVPLVHDGTSYGSLVVNAEDRDAFNDREQSAFEVLGETAGFAVNAVQNRQLLLGDDLVEFTFHVRDSDDFLPSAAADVGCTFRLEWTVPKPAGGVLLYVAASGASTDDVLAAARADDRVREVRALGDDGTLFEFEMPASTVATLFEAGAKPTEYVAEAGSARVTVEAQPSVDVDALLDAMSAAETELVAKREIGRSARTASEFRRAVESEVTDRQRSVLETAFHAGYFDWPRDSTAEEVGEALGVSSATVHYHLRRAQAALVETFLDG